MEMSRRQCVDLEITDNKGRLNFLNRYSDVARDISSIVLAESEPISQEERDRRRRQNLCWDCGSANHKAKSSQCQTPRRVRRDFTAAGGRFNKENSQEAAMIVAILESIDLYSCPKQLASEIWHNDEYLKKEGRDTISYFNRA